MSESPPAPASTLDDDLRFGGIDEAQSGYDDSPLAIWPVPFERTVSYGRGTAGGPAAILAASQNMELYDEELHVEPCAAGITTLPSFEPPATDLGAAIEQLRQSARPHLDAGKCLVTLGGEHSLTLGPVLAARDAYPELGIVQFDAHADLRSEYEGTPYSHACVMRRIFDEKIAALGIGIRSLSEPEGRLVESQGLQMIWGHELRDLSERRFQQALDLLPDDIYLTFDIDFFDPSVVPSTGTPEPGGGEWWPALTLLRELFRRKRVVAADVVELAPVVGHPASDFLAARLVYKLCAYWAEAAGLLPGQNAV